MLPKIDILKIVTSEEGTEAQSPENYVPISFEDILKALFSESEAQMELTANSTDTGQEETKKTRGDSKVKVPAYNELYKFLDKPGENTGSEVFLASPVDLPGNIKEIVHSQKDENKSHVEEMENRSGKPREYTPIPNLVIPEESMAQGADPQEDKVKTPNPFSTEPPLPRGAGILRPVSDVERPRLSVDIPADLSKGNARQGTESKTKNSGPSPSESIAQVSNPERYTYTGEKAPSDMEEISLIQNSNSYKKPEHNIDKEYSTEPSVELAHMGKTPKDEKAEKIRYQPPTDRNTGLYQEKALPETKKEENTEPANTRPLQSPKQSSPEPSGQSSYKASSQGIPIQKREDKTSETIQKKELTNKDTPPVKHAQDTKTWESLPNLPRLTDLHTKTERDRKRVLVDAEHTSQPATKNEEVKDELSMAERRFPKETRPYSEQEGKPALNDKPFSNNPRPIHKEAGNREGRNPEAINYSPLTRIGNTEESTQTFVEYEKPVHNESTSTPRQEIRHLQVRFDDTQMRFRLQNTHLQVDIKLKEEIRNALTYMDIQRLSKSLESLGLSLESFKLNGIELAGRNNRNIKRDEKERFNIRSKDEAPEKVSDSSLGGFNLNLLL